MTWQLRSTIPLALAVMTAGAAHAFDFQVRLENCSEFIGVASIPVSRLQPLVPAGYTIAVGPPGFGSLVVRAALCRNSSVDGAPNEVSKVAQVGVVLIPPDGTGDINNYTLFYSTNSARLTLKLELAGLPVSFDPDLAYEVTPNPPGAGGEMYTEVSPLLATPWFLSGSVADPPPTPNFPFTANWWYETRRGRLKMATSIPLLNYGTGSVKVFTRRQSLLGELIGGNSSSFGTNLRGVFSNGVMTVKTP